MASVFKVLPTIDEFHSILMLYKNDQNEVYLAHSFYYGGREGSKYLLFLYKDALPNFNEVIKSWNYLDDNSPNIVVVGEQDHNTAIYDFLHGFKTNLELQDVNFIEIDRYDEVDPHLDLHPILPHQVVAFIQKKTS